MVVYTVDHLSTFCPAPESSTTVFFEIKLAFEYRYVGNRVSFTSPPRSEYV